MEKDDKKIGVMFCSNHCDDDFIGKFEKVKCVICGGDCYFSNTGVVCNGNLNDKLKDFENHIEGMEKYKDDINFKYICNDCAIDITNTMVSMFKSIDSMSKEEAMDKAEKCKEKIVKLNED